MTRILLFIISTMLSFASLTAQEDFTVNRDNPQAILPQLTADPNSMVSVPLTINNMSKVKSLSVIYTFDPQILTYSNSTIAGGVLTSSLYNYLIEVIDGNKIKFTFNAKNTLFMYSGSGLVGTINFETGSYGTSPLMFTEFLINTTTYLDNTTNGEVSITSCVTAIADAGPDASITSGQLYLLNGNATDYSSVEWATQGDGVFNNTTILKPYYTPGSQDIANGEVSLCLTANGFPPCGGTTDCMHLSILPVGTYAYSMLPSLYADPGSTVTIPVQTYLLKSVQNLNITISYDPNILTYSDFNFNSSVLTNSLYNREFNYISPGLVQFNFQRKNPAFTFTGSGLVGNIIFAVGNFGISPLVFEEFTINNVNNTELCVNGQVYVSDCHNAVAFPGSNQTICEDETATLNGSANYYQSLKWITKGDGSFSNITTPNTIYTPGPQDISAGNAELCLIAYASIPCINDTSCMQLSIAQIPEVTLESFDEYCEGDESFTLTGGNPEGGVYYVDGQEANTFDPSLAGTYNILYVYTNEYGCINSATEQIIVNPMPDVTLESFDEYCEGDESFILTGGSPEGGVYYVDGQEANTFNPSFAGTYNILYVYTNEYGCINSATEQIIVNPMPDVTLEFFDEYCEGDESFILTGGSPEGGVYYVDGQEANTFDPSFAGTYNILYVYTNEYGCTNSATEQIIVNPMPDVTLESFDEYCEGDESFILTGGSPEGGIYYVDGQEANTFNPSFAGTYNILYVYTNEYGCTNSATEQIIVNPMPDVTLESFDEYCEGDESFILTGGSPEGGIYYVDGQEANTFNPSFAGTYNILYVYTNEYGCINSATEQIIVNPLPIVTCPDDLLICINTLSFVITGAEPSGGIYSGNGVEDGIFHPEVAGLGEHEIIYNYVDLNGCTGICSFIFIVAPLPTVDAGEDASICQDGNGYQLNGSVENAENFFWYTLMGTGDFDNQNVLNPIYTPSPVDYIIGSVELCLNAISISPCSEDVTDCMTLYFYSEPVVTCPPDLSVCIDEDPFLLSGASPEGGFYSGTGVLNNIFNPQLAGIGNHQITYINIDENGCVGECTFTVSVAPLPTVDAGEDASICQDGNGYQLNGSVENAENFFWYTLMGTGDFDNQNVLNPIYTPSPVDYIIGSVELCLNAISISPCSEDVTDCMTLYFYPEPVVTCPPDLSVCINEDTFLLSGASPEGGFYSGTGVLNNIFNPQLAGIGNHQITYINIDENGCVGECTFTVSVAPLPTVDAGEDASICQDGNGYQLNGSVENAENFFWYTLMGTGDFDNQNVLNPIYTPSPVDYIIGSVELCLNAISIYPCSEDVTDCMTLYFYPEPVVTCPPDLSVCIDEDPFLLSGASPEGGFYSGTGVLNNIFNPQLAGIGNHQITYINIDENGCVGECTFTVSVAPLPTVDAGEDASICQDGNGYQLNGSVENAENFFWYTLMGTGDFDNQNVLNPIYTPSPVDYIIGSVELCLNAISISPCSEDVTDCMTLYFYSEPVVTCPPDLSVCIDEDPFLLSGASPEGGFYSGTGVLNNIFNPQLAGIGNHQITYINIDENGCVGECTFTVSVAPLPTVDAGEDASICQDGNGYKLNGSVENAENFFWYTLMGTGDFDNQNVLNPIYTPSPVDYIIGSVELCLNAISISPCSEDVTDCMTLYFYPEPVVTCPPDLSVCIDEDPFLLSGASPEGGFYSGTGVLNNIFNPQLAGIGNHQITYINIDENGCVGECTFTVSVAPLPTVDAGEDASICQDGNGYQLNGSVENAENFFWYTLMGTGDFDNQNVLNPIYTPSPVDYIIGSVELCLNAISISPCSEDVTDCMTLYFYSEPVVTCPSDLSVCIDKDPFLLSGASPEGGFYSGTGVLNNIFNPQLAGIGNHQITYINIDENGCVGECTFTVSVAPLPTVDAGEDASICQDGNGYQLNGSVENAENFFWYTLMGTGDFDNQNVLNPIYTPSPVDYIIGSVELCLNAISISPCSEDVTDCMTLYFYPEPVVTCPPDLSVCIDEDPFLLSGASPEGGFYSGTGVLNNIFNPQLAGIGNHRITYINIDENGCVGECTFTVSVAPLPTVDAGEDASICQDGNGYQLNGSVENAQNFFWYTLMGTGDFDNQNVLNPIYTPGPVDYIIGSVELCLNAISISPCSEDVTDCMTLYFYPEPVVTCPPDLSVCIDEDTFLLSGASPEGGFYSGTGVLNNIFNPQLAGIGNHQITYINIDENGCVGECTFTVSVAPLPTVDTGEDASICQDGNGYQLNGSVENAQNFFWYTLMGTGDFDNQNVLNPIYTPGPVDYIIGSVELCLNAISISPCSEDVTDCMTLYFYPEPVVTCPPDLSVCIDEDPFLLSGASPEGGFYSGTGVLNNIFNPQLAGIGNHQITYDYIEYNACPGQCTFLITVNPLPTFDCPEYGPFCQSDQAVVFDKPGVFTLNGDVVTGFDPVVAGEYTFVYTETNAFGCPASCEFVIVVNPLPLFDCPEYGPFCQGDQANVFDEPGVFTLNGDVVTGFDPVVAGNYTFIYTETNAFGCSASCEFVIVVNPLPEFDCPEYGPFCQGDQAVVFDEPGVFTLNGDVVTGFDPVVTGSYTFIYTETNAFGCSASCEFVIVVNPLPTVNAGPNLTIPYGTSITISGASASGTEPLSYFWSPPNAFIDNTLLNPTTINLTASALYTLTVTDGNGCSNEDQMEIIITGGELSINPNASKEEICIGQSTQLFANASGGSGNYSYIWSSDPIGFSSDQANPIVNPEITTTYYIEVNDGYNTVTGNITITVNPLPEFDCPEYGPFCQGDQAVVFDEPGVFTLNGDVVTGFDPVVAGEYTFVYTETNAFGCSASCEFVIVVNPLPEFDCPEYGPFCQGDQAVVFDEPGVFTFNGDVVTGFDPVVAGEYTFVYTETNAFGCPASCEFEIVVNPLPEFDCPEYGPFCQGDQAVVFDEPGVFTLNGDVVTGFDPVVAGNYTFIYTETNAFGCSVSCEFVIVVNPLPLFDCPEYGPFCQSDQAVVFDEPGVFTLNGDVVTGFDPVVAGEYTFVYTETNAFGCSASCEFVIVVNPLPEFDCPEYGPFCQGDQAIVFDEPGVFTLNGDVVTGFDPVVAGNYTFIYTETNAFGCPASCEFVIVVNPLPEFGCPEYGPYCQGDQAIVFDEPGVFTLNGDVVTGFDPVVAGNYTFIYTETNAFGCSVSCEFVIVVNPLPLFDCPEYGPFCQSDQAVVFDEPGVFTLNGDVVTGFDPVVAGEYTFVYTETNAFGCSASCEFVIVVNPLPEFDCPEYGPFCQGDQAIVFDEPGVFTLNGDVVTGFDPVVAGNYTFIYTETNAFGCPASCEFVIVVNPLPEFGCPEYGPYCQGDQAIVFDEPGVFTLNGDVITGFDPVVAGEYTFVYTETNAFGCSTSCEFVIVVNPLPEFDCPEYGPYCQGDQAVVFDEPGVFTLNGDVITGFDPVVAGEYTFVYTETNAFGCPASCEFEIVVNPLPEFDCPEYGPFCQGDQAVVFDEPGVFTLNGDVVTGFDPVVAGNYTFIYTETNAFGCSASCEFVIVVNPLPLFDCPEYGPFCQSDQAVVFDEPGVFTFNGDVVTGFDPVVAGSYTFIYTETNAFGCPASCEFVIVVNPLPEFGCPEYGPFCQGDQAIVFDEPGVFTLNSDVVTGFDPVVAGEYTFVYTETNAFGCSASCEFVIVVNPLPEFDCPEYGSFCQGDQAVVFDEPGVFTLNGDVVTGFDPVVAGSYTFIYTETNAFGCSASCEFVIVVNPLPLFDCPEYGPFCQGDQAVVFDEPGVFTLNGNVVTGFDPVVAGEYTFVYTETNAFGCSASCEFVIVVNPLPTVNAGPNLTIPYGTSITISGASASGTEPLSYFWSPPNAFIDNTLLNPTTINLTASALYTLTVTDGNGCSNEDRIIILVSGSTLSVIPTAIDTEICIGQSTQLFANASGGSGNYSYIWSSDPIGFSSDQANPIVNPEITTTYYIEVNDGYNTVIGNISITVNPLPEFDCPEYGPFCQSDQAVVFDEPGVFTFNGDVVTGFDPVVAGSYTFIYTETNAFGCPASCEFVIVVNPLPEFDCPEYGPFCQGDQAVLFDEPGVFTLNGDVVTGFDPVVTGSYTFIYTEINAFGCSASCEFEIVVNPLPLFDCPEYGPFCQSDQAVVFDEPGLFTFNGDVVTEFDPVVAGSYTFIYTETNAFGCSASCEFVIVVNPLPEFDCPEYGPFCQSDQAVVFDEPGVYTLNGDVVTGFDPVVAGEYTFVYTETNAFGCPASCEFVIVVNPLPTFDCPEYGPFCQGDQAIVFDEPGVFTLNGDVVTGFDPVVAGEYTFVYTETNAFGCSASCEFVIVVNPLPTFDCPEYGPFCQSDQAVVFDEPGVFTFNGDVITGFDPVVAGEYTFVYTETNAFGCPASCEFVIVVNPLPTVNAGPNLTIPYGTSITISGASASGTEPLSYFWSPPNAFIDNTLLNPTTINLTASTLYTLTVTDGNGCSNEDQMEIIITGGELSINPNASKEEICIGQSTQLFANASGGSGNYSYIWSSDPIGFSSDQANPIVNPEITTTYYIEVNDGYNTVTGNITITVNPLPEFDCPEYGPFCQGDQAVVFDEPGVFTLNGDVVTGFDPVVAGEYTFVYTETNAFGCSASCEFVIVVNPLPEFDCPEYGPFCQGDQAVVFDEPGVFTFNGDVVTGFDPVVAGEYTFVYTETNAFGCPASCEFEIVVNPLPEFDCPEYGPFCQGDQAVVFDEPGVFTLNGDVVTGFDPVVAGNYTFIYTETNAFGCSVSCEFVIVVNPLPLFDCPEYGPFCQSDQAVVFDEPGVFTLNGDVVTGFDPVVAGEYTFVYTETNAFGCSASCEFVIVVNPLPEFDCPEYGPFCQGDQAIVFDEPGVFTLNGDVVTGFDPVVAGNYTFIYTETNAFGCPASCEFVIVVNPLPLFDCPEYGPFCQGDQAIVFDEPGVFTLNGDVVTGFDPVVAGNYTFIYTETNAFGCSASCEFVIVVNPLPLFDCPEYGPFCQSDQAVVFDEPGVFTLNGDVVTGFDPVVAGEYTFVYTETNAFGCSASCEFVIVVNPLPEFDCPEYGPYCQGDQAIVFDEPGVFTLNGDVITGFDPVVAGEYTFVYTETNAFGCSTSCEFVIVVNPLPEFDCPEYGPYCQGDQAVVFDEPGVFTLNGDVITGFDPVVAGSYTFIYTETNAFGCSASCEFVIVVNPLPEFDCPEYGPFCQSDQAVVFDEPGVYTLNGDVVTGFDPVVAGEYTFVYTETNAFGCPASCEFVIVVNPLPTFDCPEYGPFCQGDQAIVFDEPGVFTLNGDVVTGFDPVVAGSFTFIYTETNAFGCPASCEFEIVVNPLPEFDCPEYGPFCQGDQAVVFDEPGVFTLNGDVVTGFDPVVAGSYTFIYTETNAFGCSASCEFVIVVNPLPLFDCPEYGPFCQSDQAVVFDEPGVFTFNGDVVTGFDPVVAGSYTFIYTETNAFGCPASCEFVIVVNPLPEFGCPEYGPFCQGDQAIVFDEPGVFTLNGDVVTGFDPVVAGEYTFVYTETNAFGCSASCEFVIVVNPLPEFDCPEYGSFCQGDQAVVFDEPGVFTLNGDVVTGFDPVVAGSYTFIYTETNAFGCSASCEFVIVVNPLPLFDCPEYGSFCQGDQAVVFDEPGVFTLNGDVVTGFDPVVAGSYTFIYTETNAFGCSASCEFVIVVNPLPLFDCPEYGPFCQGDQAVVFDEPGVFTLNGDVVTGFDPVVAGEYTFVYTETNAFGCSAGCEFVIVVNPLPEFDCPEYGPFCQGDQAIVFDEPGVFTLNGDVVTGFDPVVAGEYTFVYTETNAFGCSASCEFAIVVNPLPTVNAGPNLTIPYGTSITISGASASGTEPLSYFWSPPNAFIDNTLLNPTTINLTASALYTLTVTDGNGCSNEDQMEIIITGGELSINPNASKEEICIGQSTQLFANASGGSGNYSYIWSSDPIGFSSDQANPIVNPEITTTYYIEVNDGYNTVTGNITITVNPLPEFGCPEYGPFCQGDQAVVFDEPGVFTLNGDVVTGFDPVVAGEYTFVYTETNAFGCSAGCEFVIVVNPLPTFDCPEYGPFCQSDQAIVFDKPGVFTLNGDVVTGFDPVVAGEYTFVYTETNAFGCSASCEFAIVVNPLPTVNAGPNLTIPYGTSITISGASASGTEPLSYFWSPPNAFIDNTLLNPTTINLTASALYTLTVTDGNGCSNEDQMEIIITGGELSINPNASKEEICIGQSTQLFANASGGSGNYSYIWSSDPIGFSSDQANPIVNPEITTTYYIEVNDGYNTVTGNITITVNPLPEFGCPEYGPFCQGDQAVVFDEPGVFTLNGDVVTGFDPVVAGEYTFVYTETNAFGCSAGCEFVIVVNPLPTFDCPEYGPFCQSDQAIVFDKPGVFTLNGDVVTGFDPVVAGEYTFVYTETNAFGCSASCEFVIVVNPLPEFDCPEYGPFCQGDQAVVFDEPGVFTFNGDVVTGFDPVVAGEYTFVYTETNAFGCPASCEFVIVVNPLPLFDCPEYGPFCQSDQAVVFDEPGVYTLNGDVVTGFDPVVAGEYTFVYTETNAFGCSASCEFVIVVNPLPEFDCPEYGPFCQGDQAIVFDEPGVFTLNGDVVTGFDPVVADSYTFIYTETNAFGCPASCEFVIVVNPLPLFDCPEYGPFCQSDQAVVFDEPGVFTFNGDVVTGFDPVVAGSYTFIYTETNAFGCPASCEFVIVVNPLPEFGCPEYGPFCQGDQAVVFDKPGVFTLNGDVVTGFDPVVTGSYTFIYTETNAFGCSASCEFVIVVNPLPTVNAGPNLTIPYGTSITISGASASGTEPLSYFWSPPNAFIDNTLLNPTTINLTASALYTLTVTDGNGCSNEDQMEIIITGGELSINPNASKEEICIGQSTQLFANASGGSGNYSYIWSSDPIGFSSNQANPIVNPEITTTYYIEVNDGYNTVTGNITITVNPLPEFDCPEYGPFCQGDQAVVFDEPGVFTLNGDVVTGFDPVVAGEYTFVYTETNAFGCSASCEFVINVHPIPVAICEDLEICITSAPIYFNPSEFETFLLDGEVITSFNPSEFTPDNYLINYLVINEFGCSNNCSFIITVLPVPVIITQPENVAELYGHDITFSITADFSTSFEWYNSDGLIMTDENVTTSILSIEKITLNDAGEYYCKVINKCGIIYSDTVYLEVLPWTQIIDLPSYLNGVSTYLNLIDCDVSSIMNQLDNDLLALEFINKVYVPGSITFCWDEVEGAKLYLKKDAWPTEFSVTGYPILGTEMPIKAGWSIIPVWSTEPVYAYDIFEQLGSNLTIAVSINYNEVYWPQGNIYTLNYLEPSRAYLIKVNNEATVMWNTIAVNHSIHHPEVTNTSVWPDPDITGNFHLISISTNAISNLNIGDYIGVFDKNGKIAGLTEVTDFSENKLLIAFADDSYSGKINGLTNGSKMYFKIYKPSTGEIADIQPLFNDDMPNSDIFYTYGMSMIESIGDEKASGEGILNNTYYINIHPNPVENITYLTSSKKIQNVKLLNITGQELMILNIHDTNGEIDLSRFESGSYLVQIQFENGLIATRQLIIK